MKAGLRLARSTPGLSLYLGGGLVVWLLTRAMVGHGLASAPLGALAVGLVRLLGLALVAILYFRRTGHLAQARVDLRRLRCLLAERKPWLEEPSRHRRGLFRLLGWSLRVRG
jgi:membrane protein implicated in regulation of membrane protease activity